MIKHFVSIYFNCWDQNKDGRNLRPEWIRDRMQVMCRYTLPSLAQQTVQDFTTLIHCAPGTQSAVEDAFALHKPSRLPQILFLYGEHSIEARSVDERVTRVLDTRLDSDDLFRDDALQRIREVSDGVEAIVPPHGYIYDQSTLKRFYWHSPPYYTFCVSPEIWNSADRYYDWWKNERSVRSHVEIREKFESAVVEEPIFLMLIHDSNTCTSFEHGAMGRKVWWFRKSAILRRFAFPG